jgi:3-oxoacyl-[acyl-carrier protein] reductase
MPSTRVSGKVALVTGASGGIGSAVARSLAAEGAAVACHYNHNKASAEALAAEIVAAGGQAIAVGADVTDAGAATALASSVVQAFGRIDILVNNAGVLNTTPFGAITTESYASDFNSSVLSTILMTQACAEHFPPSGARVVNVASNIAYKPIPGLSVYCAAKAAVISLTQGFALELGARKIAVNAVAPGATHTPMTAWMPDDLVAQLSAATPLGRLGQPGDIASVVLFLAAEESGWITGRTLIVDGGLI